MKGKRYPGRLRADGELKGRQLVFRWGWVDNNIPPSYASAERTRSQQQRAGSRRTKKCARASR